MTTWTFVPPSVEITHSINNGDTDSERFGIRFKTLLGKTVYRINGTWYADTSPSPDKWTAADIVFWGGHTYEVDDEIHNELVAAGLWQGSQNPVLEDIFVDLFLDTFGAENTPPPLSDVFAATFLETF